MWNCCLPSEPSSSVPLHPSRCVLHVSAREMLLWLTLWVDPKLIDLQEDRFFWNCPFPLVVMLDGDLRARRRDKDGDRINVPMKCTLDREDCVSLRPPIILPYAWISGRDSCLVGVSCHIPSFRHCSRLTSCVHHVYIFETWIEEYWKPQNPK